MPAQKSEEQVLEGGAADSEGRWLGGEGAVAEDEDSRANQVQRFKSRMHVDRSISDETGRVVELLYYQQRGHP